MLIFDSHAHIIPDLSGPCGYPSVEEHLLVSQKAMHEHLVQPARRTKDNKIVKKLLWDENEDNNDGKFDVNFRVGRYGRFEWNQENEDCYIQYLPTYAEKMEYPVEELKIMMDYAGIHKAVLQCGGVYGNLNDYYLNVIANDKKFSSILFPLIRIDEKEALNVEVPSESEAESVEAGEEEKQEEDSGNDATEVPVDESDSEESTEDESSSAEEE